MPTKQLDSIHYPDTIVSFHNKYCAKCVWAEGPRKETVHYEDVFKCRHPSACHRDMQPVSYLLDTAQGGIGLRTEIKRVVGRVEELFCDWFVERDSGESP